MSLALSHVAVGLVDLGSSRWLCGGALSMVCHALSELLRRWGFFCFARKDATVDGDDDAASFHSCLSREAQDAVWSGCTSTQHTSENTKRGHVESQAHDLAELRRLWQEDIRPQFMPDVDRDPYLSPADVDTLLVRFYRAERNEKSADPVHTAAERLRRTAVFRRDYRVMDFHRKGMARKLFMHGSNAGASMYFGDCGLRDADGEPVLVGRVQLMTAHTAPGRKAADKMIPCTHLRAAVFVAERAALEVRQAGSYILDLQDYPDVAMARYLHSKYWDADGVVDDTIAIKERRAPTPSVGPFLPQHETMPDGLPVLKEALRMMTTHYPELLKRVYFYRPGFLFRTVFNIFSLWVPAHTREKFIMVQEGEERKYFMAPGVLDSSIVPPELGGNGPPLDGDRFLARAVARYDAMALLSE